MKKKEKLVVYSLAEEKTKVPVERGEEDFKFFSMVRACVRNLLYYGVLVTMIVLDGIAIVTLMNDGIRNDLLRLLSNIKI